MKRIIKILSVFIIAALCVACATFLFACNKHRHTFADDYSYNETEHWREATCEHTDVRGDVGAHVFEGRQCTVCGYYHKDTVDMSGVTFTDSTVTYDGKPHSITAAGVPYGVDVIYKGNGAVNAGVYTITAEFVVDLEVYNPIPDMTATLTINKATYDMSGVVFASESFVYDGRTHSLAAQNVPAWINVTYTNNGKTEEGEYEVVAHFTGDGINYNPIPDMTATLTITRQIHTVTFRQEGQADRVFQVPDLADFDMDSLPVPVPVPGYDVEWDLGDVDLHRITQDIVVTAKMTVADYDIDYHMGGGENSPSNPPTYRMSDSDIPLSAPPARAGYDFLGWFTDAEFTRPTEKIAAGTYGDLDLYAQWDALTFTVSYETGEGAENPSSNPAEYTFDESVTLSAAKREDYTFGGWYTDGTYTERVQSLPFIRENGEAVADNLTLYAQWLYGTEGLIYTPSDSAYIVTGYGGESRNVVVPEYWLNLPVRTIGANAFAGKAVESVKLPASITRIFSGAFNGCTSLETLDAEDGISTIYAGAFTGCVNLTIYTKARAKGENWPGVDEIAVVYGYSGERGREDNGVEWAVGNGSAVICGYAGSGGDVVLPALVTGNAQYDISEIIANAFAGVNTIESVAFGEGITTLGDRAFAGCSRLARVDFAASVSSVGARAFEGCAFEEITLPQTVRYIGAQAFYGCEDCIIYTSAAARPTDWNINFSGSRPVVYNYGGEKGIIGSGEYFSSGVMHWASLVGGGAVISLYEGDAVKVSVPLQAGGYTVTSVAGYAFAGATALEEIEVDAGIGNLGYAAFAGVNSLESITLPFAKWGQDGRALFGNLFGTDNGNVPESVKRVRINGGESIGDSAFANCGYITSIALDDCIKRIEILAFSQCESLAHIEMSGVTEIGYNSFLSCTGIEDIVIPDSVTSISANAFEGCSSLRTLSIGENTANIFGGAFKDCTLLHTVYFNAINCGDISSSGNIFGGCDDLSEVIFGDKVQTVPANAFIGCAHLEEIEINANITAIKARAFQNCKALSRLLLHKDCTARIGEYAFADCKALGELILPDGVNFIDAGAFSGCTGITKVVFNAMSVGDNAFENCDGIEEVYYRGGIAQHSKIAERETSGNEHLLDEGKAYYYSEGNPYEDGYTDASDKYWHYEGGEISIWPPMPFIFSLNGDESSYSMDRMTDTSLTEIIIPADYKGYPVTAISDSAFENRDTITSIEIPASVTSIGDRAFKKCSALLGIVLPAGLRSIGAEAFSGCSAITAITIPSAVEQIGSKALAGCTSLKNIAVEAGNGVYKGDGNCIVLSESMTVIAGCAGSVIPADAQAIGEYAFSDSAIEKVDIPASVSRIGARAFELCESLSHLTFAEGLESLEENAFYGCSSLKSIILPASLKKIDYGAFLNCTSLQDVVLGGANLSPNVFENCENLSAVYFRGGADEWENLNKSNNAKLTEVTVYYFSAGYPYTEEVTEGNFWHFGADGVEIWEKQ